MSHNGFDERQGRTISIPKWYDYEEVSKRDLLNKDVFQFQNGTIMSSCQNLWLFAWLSISIPKWYDYEPFIFHEQVIFFHISIPKWYDYETYHV